MGAIAPAIKYECEHPDARSTLPPNATFPDDPNPLLRDLPHMFPKPFNGSNTSVGRTVDFIEWQAAFLPVNSFECLVSIIQRCKLKYWGAAKHVSALLICPTYQLASADWEANNITPIGKASTICRKHSKKHEGLISISTSPL